MFICMFICMYMYFEDEIEIKKGRPVGTWKSKCKNSAKELGEKCTLLNETE